MRKIIIYMLSLVMVFAPAVSFAASPNGWAVSPADIIIGAAGNTVTAIKGAGASALQSTIKHAPTAANVGKKILKGGGAAAVLMAVTQILGDGVDWVLDPANNAVKYKTPVTTPPEDPSNRYIYSFKGNDGIRYAAGSMEELAAIVCSALGAPVGSITNLVFICTGAGGGKGAVRSNNPAYDGSAPPPPVYKYLPINTVAEKVKTNAAAGHAPSQDLIKTVIIDDVNAGALDVPLNTNAVPRDGADGADGADGTNGNDGADAPPFDPSSIIAAIKSVMAAVVNMSGVLGAKIDALMIDLGLKQAETIEAITAGTGEIVAANDRTGAKVAEIVAAIEAIEGNNLSAEDINAAVQSVIDANAADTQSVIDANAANTAAISAAIEAIEGNTLDGQVINDAIDRAIAAGNANAGDIVAAVEAIEGNTLDGQVINDAVDRVIANDNVKVGDIVAAIEAIEGNTLDGQVINDAVDRVIANDNVNAQAAADAAGAAADAAGAAADKIIAADKAAADKAAADKAAADEYFKDTPPDVTPEPVVVDTLPPTKGASDFDVNYINFGGQCPVLPSFDVGIGGASSALTFDMTPLCDMAVKIRPAVIAIAYFIGLGVIASAIRET